jgi:hypothetical protein
MWTTQKIVSKETEVGTLQEKEFVLLFAIFKALLQLSGDIQVLSESFYE